MIAFAFMLPYNTLRTATAAGVRVHVLGSGPSRGLRTSRYCASYQKSRVGGNGDEDHEAILDEIAEIVRRRQIDVVFPSDDVSTRLLAAIRDRLPVRSSPMPDLATFDLVNNKWNFTRFALEHGVRVPECWLYERVDELRRDLDSGALELPVTVKPINQSGGRGVVHIRDKSEMGELDSVDYLPILIQRHIFGEMISTSVIANAGKILAYATQYRDERWFQLRVNPDFLDNVERFVAASALSGPANFDAISEEGSGLTYIVECNPRFWYTMYMSMVVGFNFLDYALGERAAASGAPATLGHGEMRLSPRAIVARPWRATRHEWALVAHHMRDPLAYIAKRKRFFDDTEVGVRPEQMRTYTAGEIASIVAPSPALVA